VSGNEYSAEAGRLSKTAAKHILAQKIPWPEHDRRHERTLLGARLFDDQCVRCWVEKHAADAQTRSSK